jgi:hypothetical protein
VYGDAANDVREIRCAREEGSWRIVMDLPPPPPIDRRRDD